MAKLVHEDSLHFERFSGHQYLNGGLDFVLPRPMCRVRI